MVIVDVENFLHVLTNAVDNPYPPIYMGHGQFRSDILAYLRFKGIVSRYHRLGLLSTPFLYKHTFFHKRILSSWIYYSLLSACIHIISTTTCMLLVLHIEQVLAHYLIIDHFSATTDYCQQMALEGSVLHPWQTIVYSSEWWGITSRIVYACSAMCFLKTYSIS